MTIRPEVQMFAELMEQKLRENDAKGGWDRCTRGYLLRRLATETRELRAAVQRRTVDPVEVAREAADVANFCMMLADVMGGLDEPSATPGTTETGRD